VVLRWRAIVLEKFVERLLAWKLSPLDYTGSTPRLIKIHRSAPTRCLLEILLIDTEYISL
jgi:hypothetical protein